MSRACADKLLLVQENSKLQVSEVNEKADDLQKKFASQVRHALDTQLHSILLFLLHVSLVCLQKLGCMHARATLHQTAAT